MKIKNKLKVTRTPNPDSPEVTDDHEPVEPIDWGDFDVVLSTDGYIEVHASKVLVHCPCGETVLVEDIYNDEPEEARCDLCGALFSVRLTAEAGEDDLEASIEEEGVIPDDEEEK